MKNRWLLNLVLALLVGGLVLVAIFKPGVEKTPTGTPLTALTPDAITSIRILRPKQPEIVLQRVDGTWQMTAPRRARANVFRVNELTRLATVPVTTRITATTGSLEQYGLTQPLATVFLNDTDIRFGAMHPLRQELYVQQNSQVVLLPATTLRAALTPLDDWYYPGLLEDKTKIVALRLPGFRLKQNAQGAWERTPALAELSSDHINRFVDEWRYARALSVTESQGKALPERITITVADGDKTVDRVFAIVARKPELVLRRVDENLDYHFPEDAIGRLLMLEPEKEPPATAAPPVNR